MDLIRELQNKKDSEAHQLLRQLEIRSTKSNELYGYFDDFVALLESKRPYVRVRGFRLACAQTQWDIENKIEKNIDILLRMLDDEKPTAVRQCLAALPIVVLYKADVMEQIENKLQRMDVTKYKDSMRPLIEKDREELRKAML